MIYLGANVPFESLEDAITKTRPTSLLFFLVRKNDKENDRDLVSQLARQFADKRIYLACEASRSENIRKSKNLLMLHDVDDLEKILK